MSTKAKPGMFDCFAKLADDEPYFVLRAKDPAAPELIERWADQREAEVGNYPKLVEARRCAMDMRIWKTAHPEAKPSISKVSKQLESAQSCGCDRGAGWVCAAHRVEQAG